MTINDTESVLCQYCGFNHEPDYKCVMRERILAGQNSPWMAEITFRDSVSATKFYEGVEGRDKAKYANRVFLYMKRPLMGQFLGSILNSSTVTGVAAYPITEGNK